MYKKLPLLVLAVVFTVLPLARPDTIKAASTERITSFDMRVNIGSDGYADITETIDYNFGGDLKHGIYRTIPTFYSTDNDNGYKTKLTLNYVTRDSRPETYSISDSGSVSTIKIGNPSIQISGDHHYNINYRMGPIPIQGEANKQIVRLDAPGTGWQVPVGKISISVVSAQPSLANYCYQGKLGNSGDLCQVTVGNEDTVFTSNRVLSEGESITSETTYPSGTFMHVAELTKKPVSNDNPFAVIAVFIVILSIVFFYIRRAIIAILYWHRRRQEIVIPIYEPPTDMSPAEIGLLIDNSVDGAEITASIIDLAVNGWISINQTKPKKWYRPAQYDLIKTNKPKDNLSAIQGEFFDVLFKKSDKISIKDLSINDDFIVFSGKFKDKLVKSLNKGGFYKSQSFFNKNLKRSMTDDGYKKWAEIAGFRRFLEFTEKDRMAYLDNPDSNPKVFSEYLPYAIAMGVEKEWIKQFKGLDVDTNGWLASSSAVPYTSLEAVSNLSQSLNTFSANSFSGSSSSGGGFFGGGLSGGGGGTW